MQISSIRILTDETSTRKCFGASRRASKNYIKKNFRLLTQNKENQIRMIFYVFILLTSGTGSSNDCFSPGMMLGKYGFKSFWSVSEYMFPIIWAADFLVPVDLSRKALCTTGIIRARDGASIKWTNWVSNNTRRQSAVFWTGFCNAASNSGTIARKSIIKLRLRSIIWN